MHRAYEELQTNGYQFQPGLQGLNVMLSGTNTTCVYIAHKCFMEKQSRAYELSTGKLGTSCTDRCSLHELDS